MSSNSPPDGYRPCVGALVLNRQGEVFIGRRAGLPADDPYCWQCPQGGLDPSETPEEGARRELFEETGIRSVTLLGQTDRWLSYDFPPEILGRRFKSYRGQAQLWFAYAFHGDHSEIDLNGDENPEFSAWKWVSMLDLPGMIVPFKRAVYDDMVSALLPIAVRHGRQGD